MGDDTASGQSTTEQPGTSGAHGRWTVGVDGSECSRHAALWAAANATGRADELHLAATWSIPVSSSMAPMGSFTTSSTFADLEEATQASVSQLAEEIASEADVPVTSSIGQGGAASLLLEAAETSDLLVVGSRGRGGFARLVLGSTSTQCATHSPAPVAVIPASSSINAVESIVVAFDGSPNSIAALQWAAAFAPDGTTIECVSVWDTSPIAVGADQFYFPDAHERSPDHFAQLAKTTIASCARRDADVRCHFVEGQPRSVLSSWSDDADLLVTGARGHGAIGSALLGSVSTWLLHHTKRPMIVVPHEHHDPPSGTQTG